MGLLTRLLVAAAATASLSLVGGVVTAGPSSAADGMTVEQAGRLYLSAACPVNTADRRFDYAMFRGRRSVTVAQMRNRLTATKRAARADASANYAFARALANPPAAWPANATAPAAAIKSKSLRLSVVYGHIAAATGPRGIFYWYDRLEAPTNSAALPVRTLRANLNLPNAGGGC
jgi:hypothetical protein